MTELRRELVALLGWFCELEDLRGESGREAHRHRLARLGGRRPEPSVRIDALVRR